jgi:hypothetical protein
MSSQDSAYTNWSTIDVPGYNRSTILRSHMDTPMITATGYAHILFWRRKFPHKITSTIPGNLPSKSYHNAIQQADRPYITSPLVLLMTAVKHFFPLDDAGSAAHHAMNACLVPCCCVGREHHRHPPAAILAMSMHGACHSSWQSV